MAAQLDLAVHLFRRFLIGVGLLPLLGRGRSWRGRGLRLDSWWGHRNCWGHRRRSLFFRNFRAQFTLCGEEASVRYGESLGFLLCHSHFTSKNRIWGRGARVVPATL